jgi:hypothetical protein
MKIIFREIAQMKPQQAKDALDALMKTIRLLYSTI